MRLPVATLCDAATIREGLLHILGGGVGAIRRDAAAPTLGVQLATLIQLEPDEMGTHEIVVRVHDVDRDRPLAHVHGRLDAEADGEADPGDPMLVPLIFPVAEVPLQGSGMVRLDVAIDGQDMACLRARALVVDSPTGPSSSGNATEDRDT